MIACYTLPMKYQAPHEVRDHAKLKSMIKTLESGGHLPAIPVCGEIALAGSHRLAAYAALEMTPDVIDIDDSDLAEAMRRCGLEPGVDDISDYGEIERALTDMGII